MKLRGWIFLILFCFPFSATAQNDFSAGTIVLNSGDTMNVLIKNITGRIAPGLVQYQTTSAAEIKTLYPRDVKWFHYKDGDWYYGYVGPIETSSLDNNNLTYDTVMHSVVDSMFIRAVIISKASLFYGRDRNDRVHLFLSKDNSSITELVYKKYYVDEIVVADYRNKITKRAIMGNEMYKGQLVQAFADCRYVSAGILTRVLTYSKNDLLKLFEDYNRCRDAKVIYREPRDNGRVEFSFLAGVNYTVLKFGSSYPPWAAVNFDNAFGWEAGIGLNWFLPNLENKFSIYNELLIKEHKLHGRVGESTTQTAVYQAVYAKLITTGRYSISKGTVRIFFEAGMSNGFAIGHTVDTTDPTIESMFLSYRNYEQGLLVGAGTSLKNFSGEFRLERSNGFSAYSDLKTAFTTWYFQLGYTL